MKNKKLIIFIFFLLFVIKISGKNFIDNTMFGTNQFIRPQIGYLGGDIFLNYDAVATSNKYGIYVGLDANISKDLLHLRVNPFFWSIELNAYYSSPNPPNVWPREDILTFVEFNSKEPATRRYYSFLKYFSFGTINKYIAIEDIAGFSFEPGILIRNYTGLNIYDIAKKGVLFYFNKS